MRPAPPQAITVLGAQTTRLDELMRALRARLEASAMSVPVQVDSLPVLPADASSLVLLCALDRQATAAEQALDARLRQRLLAARSSFCVVHGDAPAMLAQAWQAIAPPCEDAAAAKGDAATAWRGTCDKCSDPACERRLFQDLLGRSAPTEPPASPASGRPAR